MPLFYKPHTAGVGAVSATVASNEITGYAYSGFTLLIKGQLTEKTPQQALEMFGISPAFPAVWLCDLADAGSFKIGDKVQVNAREYRVIAGPQRMDAEPITAHARFLWERYA